jgi:hemolysin III
MFAAFFALCWFSVSFMLQYTRQDAAYRVSMPVSTLQRYLREPVNSLSHFVGIVLSIVGLVVLMVFSAGEPWRLASFIIYGLSSIFLYTASTLLHGLKAKERTERLLLRLDHAAIFTMIAGSYTPITLITLREHSPAWGWTIFGVVWGIAILGIIFKLFWLDAPRWLSTGLYLLMGWLAVVAGGPLIHALPASGLLWLVIGGLFYSVGALVFIFERPNLYPGILGHHELWHFLVLAGSISHFLMLFFYVLPV